MNLKLSRLKYPIPWHDLKSGSSAMATAPGPTPVDDRWKHHQAIRSNTRKNTKTEMKLVSVSQFKIIFPDK